VEVARLGKCSQQLLCRRRIGSATVCDLRRGAGLVAQRSNTPSFVAGITVRAKAEAEMGF
jgi:hypothetical protein